MATYIVNELSFVDNKLVQAGETITTDSPPATHWSPVDADAKKAFKAAFPEVEVPAPIDTTAQE